MPQADPVSACAGGPCEGKIACEALTAGDYGKEDDDPDAPPQSFWLSKDAEYDWFDRNAYFERKDSGKGVTTTSSTNLNRSINNSANSQRLSIPSNFKSKASIIGLPKTPKPGFAVDQKNRRNCRAGNACLFPNKMTVSVGKSCADASLVEPSSPKVSCMGRVRSKKDSQLRGRESCDRDPNTRRKSQFFSSFQVLFRSTGCRDSRAIAVHAPVAELPARKSSVELMARDVRDCSENSIPRMSSVNGEPPGLAGMMRFASGRRSDSWPAGGSEQ